jgi:hypothetical protein
MCAGASNEGIADRLGIQPTTVSYHINNVRERLGLESAGRATMHELEPYCAALRELGEAEAGDAEDVAQQGRARGVCWRWFLAGVVIGVVLTTAVRTGGERLLAPPIEPTPDPSATRTAQDLLAARATIDSLVAFKATVDATSGEARRPTASVVGTGTIEALAHGTASVTPTPSRTPAPTRSEIPATAPGTTLRMGDTWYGNGMRLTVLAIRLSINCPYNCAAAQFEVINLSGVSLNFEAPATAFWLEFSDDRQFPAYFPRAFNSFDSGSSRRFEVPFVLGWGDYEAFLRSPNATSVTLVVRGFNQRLPEARWEVPIHQ